MRWKAFAGCLALLGLTLIATPAEAHGHDPGRVVLGPRDGWAAATTGTTGGAAAAPGDVDTVTKRSEIAAALAAHPGAPKIVYVRGTIEGNVDANDRPVSCAGFADPGYSLPAYLAAYDPATWGKVEPSGPLEEARARSQATYFGRKFEVHDGLLDIVHGSDLVTVSYNRLHDHHKTMLIGNTDKPAYDVGKLRVTVHHNLFSNVGQRAPRVRYGQVHVYDNLYAVPDPAAYTYSLGVGVESRIYAENNFFHLPASVPLGVLVKYWKGTVLHVSGTLVSVGAAWPRPVDLLAEYNAANDPDLGPDVGWTPTLVNRFDPAWEVPLRVMAEAGPNGR